MNLLSLSDLEPFLDTSETPRVLAMIEDVEARAARIAPCIFDPLFPHRAAAKAVLRQAVIRWGSDSTGGALTQRQQTAGPFTLGESFDTRQVRRGMFLPSEIEELSALCSGSAEKSVHVGWLG